MTEDKLWQPSKSDLSAQPRQEVHSLLQDSVWLFPLSGQMVLLHIAPQVPWSQPSVQSSTIWKWWNSLPKEWVLGRWCANQGKSAIYPASPRGTFPPSSTEHSADLHSPLSAMAATYAIAAWRHKIPHGIWSSFWIFFGFLIVVQCCN